MGSPPSYNILRGGDGCPTFLVLYWGPSIEPCGWPYCLLSGSFATEDSDVTIESFSEAILVEVPPSLY